MNDQIITKIHRARRWTENNQGDYCGVLVYQSANRFIIEVFAPENRYALTCDTLQDAYRIYHDMEVINPTILRNHGFALVKVVRA